MHLNHSTLTTCTCAGFLVSLSLSYVSSTAIAQKHLVLYRMRQKHDVVRNLSVVRSGEVEKEESSKSRTAGVLDRLVDRCRQWSQS
jgi:hypothetical protein